MDSNGTDKMAGINRRTYLRDVNPHLICPLCRGYLIDATTVVECLHSFCRSCILKHLENKNYCPSCKDILNKAKPNIKADKALQDIVYKLVPGLYHREMRRRKEFYKKHPKHGYAENLNHLGGAESATPEQRGEDAASSRLFFAPEDAVSLSLEYLIPGTKPVDIDTTYNSDSKSQNNPTNRRYLQCPALVTIAHLKKFLALKYNVDITRYNIDISHRHAPLPEYLTLMDVAYIYAWKRNAPMRFFYSVVKEEQQLEAPPNDRPSTPGLGATFPPTDDKEVVSSTKDINEDIISAENDNEEQTNKVESTVTEAKEDADLKGQATKENKSGESNKNVKKDEKEEKPAREQLKEKLKTKNDLLNNKMKSPLKILKNSDGSYEVKSSSNSNLEPNSENKVEKAEFSVVSLNNGSNSNGLKITLKQCLPGNNSFKKPKMISNVLLRSPGDKQMSLVEQIKEATIKGDSYLKKDEDLKLKTEPIEKTKRKVVFSDQVNEPEVKKPKYSDEQKVKKEFLQSFDLTATEDCQNNLSERKMPEMKPLSEVKLTLEKKSSPEKNTPETKLSSEKKLSDTKLSTETKSPSEKKLSSETEPKLLETKLDKTKANVETKQQNKLLKKEDKSPGESGPGEGISKKSLDVYNFPSESPPMAGAVKRKCPPGLVITEMTRKFPANKNYLAKPNYINSPKSYRKLMKEPNSPAEHSKQPMSVVETRNLLDECGLNIPAGLSITLATSKPSTFTIPESTTTRMSVKSSDRLSQSIVEFKKPNLSAAITPIADKFRPKLLTEMTKRSEDILDLSSSPLLMKELKSDESKKPPLPVIKQVPAKTQSKLKKGQYVTLMGGQKFYRAPPGSLTPAAHRDFSPPQQARRPVYATGLIGSSSNNLSSAFPTLQSLIVQYQSDQMKGSQDSSPAPKSHLVAQCPPVKPSRASLVVPKHAPQNWFQRWVQTPDNKHISFDKPTSNVQLANNTQTLSSTQMSNNVKAQGNNAQTSSIVKESNDAQTSNNAKQLTINAQTSSSADVGSSAQSKEASSPAERSAASPRVSSTSSESPTLESSSQIKLKTEKSPESPDSSVEVKGEKNKSQEDTQKRAKEWINAGHEHLDNVIKNLKIRVENKADKLEQVTVEAKKNTF